MPQLSLRILSLLGLPLLALSFSAGGACNRRDQAQAVSALRPEASPSEYVGMTVEMPVNAEDIESLLSPLFGGKAQDGDLSGGLTLQPGLTLSVEADPRTAEQVILTLEMQTSTGAQPGTRTLARVPAGLATGTLFVDTVAVALDTASQKDTSDLEPWLLEYRLRSAQGGALTIAVEDKGTGPVLRVTARGPQTSLLTGQLNTPAREGDPYETIYGRVYFTMTRDHFDFFTSRAYGVSAGKAQNFSDFLLLPHDWLRLTVTPLLDDGLVDVGFEVVTLDGRRLPVAKAPASLVGGEQFTQTVFLLIDNMLAAEEAEPGSSTPFEAPYYYDDPDGGGVVEVVATGAGGIFRVAYAVESPTTYLQDVDFVPFQGTVTVPADWDKVDPTCDELGSTPSAQGSFELKFQASSTVLNSDNLDGPLQGNVWGSIYRAEDVRIDGPLEGTEPVASFAFEDVDISGASEPLTYPIPELLNAGDYQVLGFMDIDGNADPDNADPDKYDPVMIPIGGYTLECSVQPVTVEFAILMP